MKRMALNAKNLRFILIAVLLVAIAVASGAFYVAQGMLRDYAVTISALNAKADSTDQNLRTLRKLEVELSKEASTAVKARDIVAESKQYVYQDQIIEDIVDIARSSGVTVTGFNFSDTSTGATVAPTTGSAAPSVPVASDANSKQVSVTIRSPVSYSSVMNFIQRIEKNPLKMQISNISMSRSSESAGLVGSESFTIKVYVR